MAWRQGDVLFLVLQELLGFKRANYAMLYRAEHHCFTSFGLWRRLLTEDFEKYFGREMLATTVHRQDRGSMPLREVVGEA